MRGLEQVSWTIPLGSPLKFGSIKPSFRAQVPSRTDRTCHQAALQCQTGKGLRGHSSMPSGWGTHTTPLGLLRPQVQGVLLPGITDFNYKPQQPGMKGNTTAPKLWFFSIMEVPKVRTLEKEILFKEENFTCITARHVNVNTSPHQCDYCQ